MLSLVTISCKIASAPSVCQLDQAPWDGFCVDGTGHTGSKCFAGKFTATVKLNIQLYYLLGFIIQEDI